VTTRTAENEGDLIFAAEHATTELVAFIYAPLDLRLHLVPLTEEEADASTSRRCSTPIKTAGYGVRGDRGRAGSVRRHSAADRAHTIRLLASPDTRPADLARPGHVVPLRARPAACCASRTHRGAIDLAVLAGLRPAGVLCEWSTTTAPNDAGCPTWRSSPSSTDLWR